MARSKPEKPAAPGREGRAGRGRRIEQIRTAFTFARENDPKLVPIMFGPAVGILAVLVVVGVLTGNPVTLSILGVLAAILWMTVMFGRRVEGASMKQVEGKPGASLAVASMMRGWKVDQTPANFTKAQDLVFRAVGRPGVVLLGEGPPHRISQLLVAEKRRVARVVGDVPIYDVQVGDAEGQVPLRKLRQHLAKLPRNIKPNQYDIVESRLRALNLPGQLPMPKGPMPRNMRMPRKMR